MQADYANGVLHLTIPVKQSAQPRRIQVGQGSQQQAGQQPRVIDVASGEQQGSRQQGAEGGTSPS